MLAIAVVMAVALGAAPALGGESPRKPDEKVWVKDNFFSPRSLSIDEGDDVRWVWRGNNRHNVAFKRVPKGAWKKGGKTRRDGRWQRTFRDSGTYRYVCTLFAGMRGSITVKKASPPAGD